MTELTILAPAYNEEDVIADFVDAVSAAAPDGAEILVIDDGSTDATASILEELSVGHPQVRVVAHSNNRGLGAALATGFGEAAGTVIVTMDADLSHPLELIDSLAVACESADAAYGSRYVAGGGMIGVPWWRRLISRVANVILRIAYLAPVRDLTTGYRAYRTAAVRDLTVTGQRFEAQLEISIRLISAGCHIVEIPLVLENRAAGESKMRYLRLIPAYASMAIRMLGVRWLSIFRGWRARD